MNSKQIIQMMAVCGLPEAIEAPFDVLRGRIVRVWLRDYGCDINDSRYLSGLQRRRRR
jgi:hypothetical protein